MNSVLVVDDEVNIVNVLKEYLEYHNFCVDVAADGLEAFGKASEKDYDCILLDIMMPNLNGYDTVKAIREIKDTPIILVSAKGEHGDKLKGFDLGVDDYITKPFYLPEVLARVKAVLKRTSGYAEYLKSEGVEINMSARTVQIDGKEVELTNKEYELLIMFLNNKNILLTRDRIFSEIWGWDYESDGRTLDTHIKMLRSHLGQYGKNIKTVRGVGYKFGTNE